MTDIAQSAMALNAQRGVLITWAGDTDADLSATIASDWIKQDEKDAVIFIDFLWTGTPVGVLTVEAQGAGPAKDLNLAGIDAVTGTYSGILTANEADLPNEDIGCIQINITGLGAGRFRLKYTSGSSTGTGNARVRRVTT